MDEVLVRELLAYLRFADVCGSLPEGGQAGKPITVTFLSHIDY
jgi:hypothetical protein